MAPTAGQAGAGPSFAGDSPPSPLDITIIIPGEPKGQARHRTGQGRTYTPRATTQQQALIRSLVQDVQPGVVPTTKPVAVRIIAKVGVPSNFSKARKAAAHTGALRPDKKPDADNVIKLVLDAIQIPDRTPQQKRRWALDGQLGYLIHDDSQVVELEYLKFFCASDDIPHTSVRVFEIAGAEGAYRK